MNQHRSRSAAATVFALAVLFVAALTELTFSALRSPAGAQPIPGVEADPCAAPPPPQPGPTALAAPEHISVEPGQAVAFTAVADIGPRPTPVDVFFVIDSSNSMGPVFDSLKLSIHKAAADLAASGIDVHVGVADFSDLRTRPYRRLLALEPVDCDIVRALATVTTSGGIEPHRLALEQAITGSGRREVGVPVGLSGGFRPGTLRLVVHATDERVENQLPFSPTHAALTEMFRRERVLHVGLQVAPVSGVTGDVAAFDDPERVRRDLDALSRDTGALAPASGIDCDGDGTVDVRPGAPVTCRFGIGVTTGSGAVGQASVGQLVTQIVRALRSTTAVSLGASADGRLEVAIDPATRDVDLSVPARATYDVTVRCGPEGVGQEIPLRTQVGVAAQTAATALTRVTCLAPLIAAAPQLAAAAPPPPEPPLPAPTAAPAPAPAPSPGPSGASAPGVAGSTASSPASSSAAAPASAFAAVPVEEVQVAEEWADPGVAVRGAGAAGLAFAAAVALRRRQAVATEHERR